GGGAADAPPPASPLRTGSLVPTPSAQGRAQGVGLAGSRQGGGLGRGSIVERGLERPRQRPLLRRWPPGLDGLGPILGPLAELAVGARGHDLLVEPEGFRPLAELLVGERAPGERA